MKYAILLCLCFFCFKSILIAQKTSKKIYADIGIGLGCSLTTDLHAEKSAALSLGYNFSEKLGLGVNSVLVVYGFSKGRYRECHCFQGLGIETKYQFNDIFYTKIAVGKMLNFKAYNLYETSIVERDISLFLTDDKLYPYASLSIGMTVFKNIEIGFRYLTTTKLSGEVQVAYPPQIYALEKDFRYRHFHGFMGYSF